MSESELAQGFGFNLTAVPVLAEPPTDVRCGNDANTHQATVPKSEAKENGEARESTNITGDSARQKSKSCSATDSRGGSQSLCGKPRRTGVRQGQRGAAGKHGCSLAAPDSLSGPKGLRQVRDTSEGGESSTCCGLENRHEESAPAQSSLGGDELHRDPFFSSKHKLKEIWRPRKRSIQLMGGDF